MQDIFRVIWSQRGELLDLLHPVQECSTVYMHGISSFGSILAT